ncbi:MAG: cation transporter [Beijerinckiaceae bacterium]|jgi:Co/Zn/Cd efflux system component
MLARDGGLRRSIRLVVALNLGFFVIETIAALSTGSVSLFADSVDFLEDASINLLILAGLAWTGRARARLGMSLAGIILLPSLAAFVMAWHRFMTGTAPDAVVLGVTGLGALAVNSACALLLARHRASGGTLTKAAFLSARNDTIANIAIIAAGVLTAATRSPWPDLSVGLAIALLNAGAAHEVFTAARVEGRD